MFTSPHAMKRAFLNPIGSACALICLINTFHSALLPAVAGKNAPLRITTERYDNARTSANLVETLLTPANVTENTFGKLFTRAVDGYLYAQPLYIEHLKIGPQNDYHNVIFLATEHNTVYAFDADDPTASTPFWSVNLGPTVPCSDLDGGPWGVYQDLTPEIGITSTPVIDPVAGTIYVVAKTKENGKYFQRLYALDIQTGAERLGSPVLISPSISGTGDGAVNGIVPFNSLKELNRAALLLSRGVVYIAFASHADFPPFHGWVLGYDAKTLALTAVFNTSPNGAGDGIWQSGGGLSSDENGDVFAATGNGTFDADSGGHDFGNTVLRLHPTPQGLTVTDWFTPADQANMTAGDHDLGTSCPVYLRDQHRVIIGGKNQMLYVLNAAKLGKYNPSGDTQIPQSFKIADGHIHGAPIYWNGQTGPRIYIWSEYDYLKEFAFQNGILNTTPTSTSPDSVPDGMPGGFMTISADGSKKGTGIVWASRPFLEDANRQTVAGIFEAYDAEDVSKLLWSSENNPDRDRVGSFAKFNPPLVANGKVYLATFSGQLVVYGLLPKAPAAPVVPAPAVPAPAGQ